MVQQALAAGGQVTASSWSVERCRMLADLQLKVRLGVQAKELHHVAPCQVVAIKSVGVA